ncbi:MAG: MarR family winged helix-turn-helix transcriptional regulator [Albimonas sp.]|uniref:MarR family winged helix-turn-helix transcriptional regulator n=1 Tax=Albimonas sp. TaxID=1872425 RepID=UPI0040576F34|tara:strand:+ start:1710 stop:2174 length:465 start_codon:yes stop_codon:yes gene_type:complete
MPEPTPSAAPSEVTDERLRQFAGYNMKRVYMKVRADMTGTLAPAGLRVATFSALAVILENPDITQTQLAQALKVERSGVVVLVDELENADLIARNRVKGDRRSYALRATLKGRRAWAKAEALVHAHEARLFAALAPEDRERLHALLLAIDRATD